MSNHNQSSDDDESSSLIRHSSFEVGHALPPCVCTDKPFQSTLKKKADSEKKPKRKTVCISTVQKEKSLVDVSKDEKEEMRRRTLAHLKELDRRVTVVMNKELSNVLEEIKTAQSSICNRLAGLISYLPTKESISQHAERVRETYWAKRLDQILSHKAMQAISIILTFISLFLRDFVYFWLPNTYDVPLSFDFSFEKFKY